MKRGTRGRFLLLTFLLAGTALRLYRLGAESLWYDETVSTYLAGSPLPELVRHTAGDIHPPGYYILLRGWLIAAGYPTGHADAGGLGLEHTAAFLSLFAGVLLIALTYALARRGARRGVALVAAAIVAASPYNVWYSQEVRMYTLAAGLAVLTSYALLRALTSGPGERAPLWWAVYAGAGAAGMYTVYYFAFLLAALSLWALALMAIGSVSRRQAPAWISASAGVLILYVPWLGIAWRQATDPPVPPWRAAVGPLEALRESLTALGLGQSAPACTWPALLLVVAACVLGVVVLLRGASRGRGDAAESAARLAGSLFPAATFGPLVLILAASAALTPLYHVRYLFTYSPPFYILPAAGLVWLWQRRRIVAAIAAAGWLAAAGATLAAFWGDPLYRADDLRGATAYLEEQWLPGDVVVVNAGYTYPALLTYWQGAVGGLSRITATLPDPRSDPALVAVLTGHVDGDPSLGWGDPRSDFYAMPWPQARDQMGELFARFGRVWHYRLYDTVNDPAGRLRGELERLGQPIEDRVFSGEANMRVQGFIPRAGAEWHPDRPSVAYGPGVSLQWEPLPAEAEAGQIIYPLLTWRADRQPDTDIATSLRLVAPDGVVWSQPPDRRPLGERFTARAWGDGLIARQPLALPVAPGTPPGQYAVELLVYDPATGSPFPPLGGPRQPASTPGGLLLGWLSIGRPASPPAGQRALAVFGPLALIEATSPATRVGPGDAIPVEILWQAREAPAEPFVVVLQLLSRDGRVAASLEAEPLDGRYPTQVWAKGELVRDRHTLVVPHNVPTGAYRLIVGLYRGSDRVRLTTRTGLLSASDHFTIKGVEVQ